MNGYRYNVSLQFTNSWLSAPKGQYYPCINLHTTMASADEFMFITISQFDMMSG